jgi:hypothetical protein
VKTHSLTHSLEELNTLVRFLQLLHSSLKNRTTVSLAKESFSFMMSSAHLLRVERKKKETRKNELGPSVATPSKNEIFVFRSILKPQVGFEDSKTLMLGSSWLL